MRRFNLTTALFALTLLTTLTPRADAHHTSRDHGADIVDTAVGAGSFETLVAAVQAAGVVETLKGSGPFTVFAPTDEAFAALPPGTVERLLEPANRDALRALLTYHVVAGRVPAAAAGALRNAETVNGQRVAIKVEEGRLKIDQATVQSTDIGASNGVVHVIDTVLLPPELRAASARPAEMTTGASAESVIRLAIQRGVPPFNDGNPGACAAIYEVAVTSLLSGGYDLPSAARTALEASLRNAAREDDDRGRAWALRHGLDDARQALHERMASRTHG